VKKIVGAVELTEKGKVRRAYFKGITDYSSKSLRTIFDSHISSDATIYTDKWTGYKPLADTYTIYQKYSDKGNSMRQMHTIIHQLKSWLRSIYSWMHEEHLEKHLDEFSFRLNLSIYKDTIFHKLIERVINHQPVTYQMITVST
jgi:transposase-like protein